MDARRHPKRNIRRAVELYREKITIHHYTKSSTRIGISLCKFSLGHYSDGKLIWCSNYQRTTSFSTNEAKCGREIQNAQKKWYKYTDLSQLFFRIFSGVREHKWMENETLCAHCSTVVTRYVCQREEFNSKKLAIVIVISNLYFRFAAQIHFTSKVDKNTYAWNTMISAQLLQNALCFMLSCRMIYNTIHSHSYCHEFFVDATMVIFPNNNIYYSICAELNVIFVFCFHQSETNKKTQIKIIYGFKQKWEDGWFDSNEFKPNIIIHYLFFISFAIDLCDRDQCSR